MKKILNEEFFKALYSENGKISSTRYVFVSLSRLVWVIVIYCLILSSLMLVGLTAPYINPMLDGIINDDTTELIKSILNFSFSILTSIVSAMTVLKVGQSAVEKGLSKKSDRIPESSEEEKK